MNTYREPSCAAPAMTCCRPDFRAPLLETVHVDAVLENLLGQTEVRQSFRNSESVPVEAVYTFPVPLGAVLLGLTARIGGRDLVGQIMPAAMAENDYEEAVTDGDAAILLQEAGPGLYTVNVGNLLAGERIEICYRYAQLQYWAGDTLRFALPTVIAPRYGNAEAAGLQPHQVPVTDLSADQRLGIRITVRGLLQEAEITCATHRIQIDRGQGNQFLDDREPGAHFAESVVRFEGLEEQSMDRDIILNLRRRPGRDQGSALVDFVPGTDTVTALLTFCPSHDEPVSPAPRFVKVLVDCSGSMQGDSIRQAREALLRILDSLRPQDWFTIVAFGSTHRSVTGPPQRADALAVEQARQAVRTVHADLGGTELRSALRVITALKAPTGHGTEPVPADILLITDGELFDAELVEEARLAGDRVFTVGVGCAPGESLLAALSDATGGAAEFVTPTDDMAGRVHRHFQRLYQPRLARLDIQWPGEVLLERRDRQGGMFAGDTIHVLARLKGVQPEQMCAYSESRASRSGYPVCVCPAPYTFPIRYELENGESGLLTQSLCRRPDQVGGVPTADLLDRLLVAGAIASARHLRPAAAVVRQLTDEALRCQLMSPWTSCLVVARRAEGQKTDGDPALRRISQMMAAGSHGFGSVDALHCKIMGGSSSVRYCMELESAGDPACILPDDDTDTWTIDRLAALGVAAPLLAELRRLVDAGADEHEVCLLCLHALLKSRRKLKGLGRDRERLVRQQAKQWGVDAALVRVVEEMVGRSG